jgi:quercetin dioxygenase-like cupin family protein
MEVESMSFFHWDTVPTHTLDIAPHVKRKIVHLANVMIMHLEIPPGINVPQHHHPHEQIGIILKGHVEMVLGTTTHVISAGEGYIIPSNIPHSSRTIGENLCVLLDIFSPIQEDFLPQE